MTDNEKLIEEAAKAMANAPHACGWDAHIEAERDWYLKDAAIALAVFEKAHAPTDDEREVMERIIDPFVEQAMGDYGSGTYEPYSITDALTAAGFRRSERTQGEPSDAQVEAAMEAYAKYRESDGPGDAMRAALRAAGGAR